MGCHRPEACSRLDRKSRDGRLYRSDNCPLVKTGHWRGRFWTRPDWSRDGMRAAIRFARVRNVEEDATDGSRSRRNDLALDQKVDQHFCFPMSDCHFPALLGSNEWSN